MKRIDRFQRPAAAATWLRLSRRIVVAVLAFLVLQPAAAQRDRPYTFILPGTAGSGVDNITRAAAPALSKALGGPVVVDDQPGAGGLMGTSALVRSPPDGFTLSVVSSNHVIYPSVYKSLPFDPLTDVTPIAIIGSTPIVLVVNPARLPAKTARGLIELLKAKPAGYNYGSSGNGTILHLAGEMFLDEAGVSAVHVPYKGASPMLTDLLGGQIDFALAALPTVQQHLQSGALVAIGVTGPKRVSIAPDIPTMAEQGLPGYVIETWFAVVGPARMDAATIARVNAAFVTAFAAPDVRATMARQGNTIDVSTPEYAVKFFASASEKYSKLAKLARLTPQ
ncbi:MAG: tripartite tricarboxylate transporter substrate binding protein [Casimicrobiaceae bacterium]